MNTNKPTHVLYMRIIRHILTGLILVLAVVGLVYLISSNFRSAPESQEQKNDTQSASVLNDFTLLQDVSTQTIKDIDVQERSTDILVKYPDGKTFKIDSNYIEPITDVSKVDINFDGVQDVRVDLSMGAYNMGTDFYVQNPRTRTFTLYDITGRNLTEEGDIFPGLGSVTIDEKTKTLESFFKGRGLGDIYTIEKYQFINNAWHLISQESQDTYYVPGLSGQDGWGPYYINEVVDFTKNKPATTTKYLELKERDGQFDFTEIQKPVGKK